jgi:hypothetical protein
VRKLAIAPCSVFLFFSALSASIYLLDIAPSSTILWWANVEVFTRFRTPYYFLEAFVSPDALILALLFAFLAATSAALIATSVLGPAFRRYAAFSLNHAAALVIGISLVTPYVAPVAISDGGIVASGWSVLSPVFSMRNSLNLFMLLPVLVSCAGCHWALLSWRLRRTSKFSRRRPAGDLATDIAFPSTPIPHPA